MIRKRQETYREKRSKYPLGLFAAFILFFSSITSFNAHGYNSKIEEDSIQHETNIKIENNKTEKNIDPNIIDVYIDFERFENDYAHQKLTYQSTAKVIAGPNYKASNFKKFFLGEHYRVAWTTAIDVPVIDLQNSHGGLTPVKKGGGMQTKSLRLSAENGHQYVFRSIQKDPSSALPEEFQNTIADDILQDQISSAHPYGAFVVPKLAEASGLFHSKPELGIIPDDPTLGQYRSDFANQLVLFEQRADDNLSDIKNFGYTKNAISTDKLLKKMLNDNDIIIDEEALLKNRLFDMFLGDWDRHEDQWRWAEFACKSEDHKTCDHLPENDKFYVPISRDRDQVFPKFDGLLPGMAGRKWMVRKFQHFDYDIRDMAGINFNARYLDRTFLTRLEKDQWMERATE